MANKVAIDVKINALEAAQSLKELNQGIKDARNQLAGLEVGSAEFNKLAGAIDDAKDKVEEINRGVEQVGLAGKFSAIAKAGAGIAAGFEVAQGAMALFGSEGKEVEEAMKKVQAAMALAQGLSEISEMGKAFGDLKNIAVGTFNSIKASITSTGIGAIVIAIGVALAAIVVYWDDIKEAVGGVSEEQKKLTEETKKQYEVEQKKLQSIKDTENILKLQGKTEKEILEMKIKQIDVEIKKGEIALKNQEIELKGQVENTKRWQKFIDWFATVGTEVILLPWRTAAASVDLLIMQWNTLAGALGKDTLKIDTLNSKLTDLRKFATEKISTYLFDPKETEDKGLEAIEKEKANLIKLKNEQAGYQLQIKEMDKKANEEKVKGTKDTNDKIIHIDKKYLEELQTIRLEEIEINNKTNDDILKSNFDFEKAKLELLQMNSDKKKRLNQSNYDEEYEIAQIQLDKILNDENKGFQDRLIAQEKFNARVAELDKIENERKQAAMMATLNVTKSGLQATADLVNSFAGKSRESQKKAFEFQKGVNIATATIDTFQSAVAAYKGSIGIPIVGPVLAPIAAAIAVAAGIANIRKIEQTKFDSKETPSGSGGGGGGGSFAPNLSAPVGNTSTNLASIGFGQDQQPEPVKVFVTETDISSSQKNVQKIEQKASIE